MLEHKCQTRNNSKTIKLPPVKLELAKQGFYFCGGVLYNSLSIEVIDTDGNWNFTETVKDIKISFNFCEYYENNICNTTFYSYKISNPVVNEIIFFTHKYLVPS